MSVLIDGKTLRDAIVSGANNIAVHRAEVDELNVFPVPDGDTGTNMSMTMAAARADLMILDDRCTVDDAAKTAASAMLRGARGNSGVITSLLFRGFSKALAGKKKAAPLDVVHAMQKGVSSAYKAVMKPTEGTMLTVARITSETISEREYQGMGEMWQSIVKTARGALAETPEQLPILKKAGVVDAGGMGLCFILEGMKSVILAGEIIEGEKGPVKPKAHIPSTKLGKGVFSTELNPDLTNGYCTEFLVNKQNGADAVKLRAFLEKNGDSVVVVDDDDIIKCHVHTENPGEILSKALDFGYLTRIKIENMHDQFESRQAEAILMERQAEVESTQEEGAEFPYAPVDSDRKYGFVAVAAGEGLHEVFKDLGADAIVTGGQTMNPSTEDILKAVQSVPAGTVFVLPNNKNIIMAAEQAIRLADREVVVLPTRTVPQGMSAMLAFDPDADSENNTIAMKLAADKVSTGQITFAARDSEFDGRKIKEGEILGIENGKLSIVGTDITKVTYRLARSMCRRDTSFVTLISGSDVNEEDATATLETVRQKIPPNIEVTHIKGGQPVYYYLISVE